MDKGGTAPSAGAVEYTDCNSGEGKEYTPALKIAYIHQYKEAMNIKTNKERLIKSADDNWSVIIFDRKKNEDRIRKKNKFIVISSDELAKWYTRCDVHG